jgi:RNA polymerase sigma factor (sigma-70 family)
VVPPAKEPPSLADLLDRHRAALVLWIEGAAGGLVKHESAEDLAQGVHLRALNAAGHFQYQGEAAFVRWLRSVARQHISDRHAYWSATKCDAAGMLRISTGGGGSTASAKSGVDPRASATGPLTFAARREIVTVAMKAVDLLPERDRKIVRWVTEGKDIAEIAEALGVSYDAAERARLRAIERFRGAFRALSPPGRRRDDSGP